MVIGGEVGVEVREGLRGRRRRSCRGRTLVGEGGLRFRLVLLGRSRCSDTDEAKIASEGEKSGVEKFRWDVNILVHVSQATKCSTRRPDATAQRPNVCRTIRDSAFAATAVLLSFFSPQVEHESFPGLLVSFGSKVQRPEARGGTSGTRA